MSEEVSDESIAVKLELKEIPAGFSTLNKRFEYENVNIQKNELHASLVLPVTGCVV